eukprot:TRINITY_DN6135_c0_g3_i5.p1 TRINITY_DN6135_c0_g3~~TRINITY_DN6135_c0_g3_i5.p1  ORF type:complete len:290 (-),score=44.57 TRINITY_DN6135_c0_g3_i5:62-847(-)
MCIRDRVSTQSTWGIISSEERVQNIEKCFPQVQTPIRMPIRICQTNPNLLLASSLRSKILYYLIPFVALLPTNNVIAAPPIITGTKLLPPGMPMMGMPPLGMPGLIPNDPTKGAAGAPGMLPPGAAANMLFPGFVLPGATPLMMTNAKPGFPLMNPMMNPFQPMKPPEVTKKVFVKNIPSDVPDTFMEDLLRECGHVISWKRTKNEQDKPVPFGYCEFETMEGVLKSMRLLNNVKLVDNQLQIKPAAQTELAIKELSLIHI